MACPRPVRANALLLEHRLTAKILRAPFHNYGEEITTSSLPILHAIFTVKALS